MPKWDCWTETAIECYKRGGICEGCLLHGTLDAECQMKQSVIELVCQFGAPVIIPELFEGLSDIENRIINAIANGAVRRADIAERAGIAKNSLQNYLTHLYILAETHGTIFTNGSDKLPDLIRFITEKAKENKKMNIDYYLKGRSLFDIEGELNGKIKEFKNVPLLYFKRFDPEEEINGTTGESFCPSYEAVVDYYDKNDYFDITDTDCFDPVEPSEGETDIGDYRVIKVLRFSAGHSVEDLKWE